MEDFVTYEQAVKLKELGFDWKVRACYLQKFILDTDSPHYTEPKFLHNDAMRKRWTTNYNDNRCGGGTGKFYCSAPTLAQAAKWIRNKGLFIHIYLHLDDCWRFELQDVNYIDKYIYEPEVGLWWKTYENALSEGINRAIDLLTYKTEKK